MPLRIFSNSHSNDYSWVKIGVKTVEILRKPWKVCQQASRGHNFWSNHWNFNFFSFLKTRHLELSRDTKISSIRVRKELKIVIRSQNWKSTIGRICWCHDDINGGSLRVVDSTWRPYKVRRAPKIMPRTIKISWHPKLDQN